MSKYKGQCLCGGIRFEVEKIDSKMAHCHCTMCRRFHGAAFSTFGEAKREDFHWLQGEQLLKTYTAENQSKRKFCASCGSSLIFEPANNSQATVEFALAALDHAPGLTPDAHIYTSTKVEWLELDDGLPHFVEARASESKV